MSFMAVATVYEKLTIYRHAACSFPCHFCSNFQQLVCNHRFKHNNGLKLKKQVKLDTFVRHLSETGIMNPIYFGLENQEVLNTNLFLRHSILQQDINLRLMVSWKSWYGLKRALISISSSMPMIS